jgi:hypothetical protein
MQRGTFLLVGPGKEERCGVDSPLRGGELRVLRQYDVNGRMAPTCLYRKIRARQGHRTAFTTGLPLWVEHEVVQNELTASLNRSIRRVGSTSYRSV